MGGKTGEKCDELSEFVNTPNVDICRGVMELLRKRGVCMSTSPEEVVSRHGTNACLLVDGVGFCHRGWYESGGYKEISIPALWKRLEKPTHTLMTEEELGKRYRKEDGLKGALKLSIEKWERCLKEENWDTLCGNHDLINEGTCGLCVHIRDIHPSGTFKKACLECPLYMGYTCGNDEHPWQKAHQALRGEHREHFYVYGGELIDKMKEALEELKDDGYIPVPLIDNSSTIFPKGHPLHNKIQIREGGLYGRKALFVSAQVEVELVNDNDGYEVIRFKKGGDKHGGKI